MIGLRINLHTCNGASPILTDSVAFLNCSSNGLTFWRSWKRPTSSPYLINLVGVGVWSAKIKQKISMGLMLLGLKTPRQTYLYKHVFQREIEICHASFCVLLDGLRWWSSKINKGCYQRYLQNKKPKIFLFLKTFLPFRSLVGYTRKAFWCPSSLIELEIFFTRQR